MLPFVITDSQEFINDEVLSLYNAVGWSAYTDSPDLLFQAIRNSSFVISARDQEGNLIGLARVISDDATICYIQDILIHPRFQRTGIGRALFDQIMTRYQHVRQTVLITDDEPRQRAFYESMGLTEGAEFPVGPLRLFAKLG